MGPRPRLRLHRRRVGQDRPGRHPRVHGALLCVQEGLNGSRVMSIVDAQVHLNQLVDNWREASPDSIIATAITTMNAIGVDRVLIAESRGFDANMRPALGPALPNGAIRAEYPF